MGKTKNKLKNKLKRKLGIVMLIAGITLITALILMLIGSQMRASVVKEKQQAEEYYEWLYENCNCLERERYYCPDDFVLNGSYCFGIKEKVYTLRIFGCSEYDCSGELKFWNNKTEAWENKTGGLE